MSGGLNMGANSITELSVPTANISDRDAINRGYADTKLGKSGGSMDGSINMQQNRIGGLPTPTVSDEAANKGYVDDAVRAVIPLTRKISALSRKDMFQLQASSMFSAEYGPWVVTDPEEPAVAPTYPWAWVPSGTDTAPWLRFTFPFARRVTGLTIAPRNHVSNNIQSWTLSGSNDGTTWTDLYTGGLLPYTTGSQFVPVSSQQAYRMYTVSLLGFQYCSLRYLELFGY